MENSTTIIQIGLKRNWLKQLLKCEWVITSFFLVFMRFSKFLPKPSAQSNVNLLSLYDNEKSVSGFEREAVALSRSACEGSGSKDNNEWINFLTRRVVLN